MKYSPSIVTAYFKAQGIPSPIYELRFAHPRRWRFDLAWPDYKVYLEVQGALFSGGRHTRGASLLKEYEKINTASSMGWLILYCIPSQLCKKETAELIKKTLDTRTP